MEFANCSIAQRMLKVGSCICMWCSCSFIHVVMGHVHGLLIVKRREEQHLSCLVLSIILNMQLCNILFNIFGDNKSVL